MRGLALIAVLWLVAALSVLVVGVSASVRAEVRGAQLARAQAEAAALGDAAIQLAVLELRTASSLPTGERRITYEIAGHPVLLTLTPAAGFVNLNSASEALLKDLFLYAAGLSELEAETLAQRILDWRDPDDAALPRGAELDAYLVAGQFVRPRNGPFAVPEDLMQVLGVDFDLYVRIAGFLTVHGNLSAIDPLAAPVGLLTVLAKGDRSVAERLFAQREAAFAAGGDGSDIDTTMLESAHLGQSGAGPFRLEARVELGGRVLSRVRWIDLNREGVEGEPWRSLRVEPVRGVMTGESPDGA